MNQHQKGEGGYRPFDVDSVKGYLASNPAVAERLGGGAEAMQAREVGDGNLNLVFIIEGPKGSVVVKQALPYVRLVGDSWPLPLKRAFFEWNALTRQAAILPDRVPSLYHFDETNALVVMEYLSPHIILRKELIAGKRFEHLAEHAGTFLAETLFRTSDLHMDTAQKKADVALFADNVALCAITENLVFTEPYFDAELNRWTTPELDGPALALRGDRAVKIAAQEMLHLFTAKTEALLHGDLHTGSIMVTETDSRVIDPEFAFYGPMGFDIGALLANLFLAYFSQDGHGQQPGARDEYGEWLLETTEKVWRVFAARFSKLWTEERTGILFPRSMFEDQGDHVGAAVALERFLDGVFTDTTGFAGAKMIRRLVGLAHVEDMESIEDPATRAGCEARALQMGCELLVNRGRFSDISALTNLARAIRRERTQP
ncbi:S-methyl-5-thioribose kinase [Jiella marina]|uniref:S-methyl-5-thioribose kinase n=1 Tax=Jiella sp. LLJ827 TaxID=2917712 RepID=UPI0021017CBF|nr:S-methyl-5-thioribose kinase [Jiella sp. LLJ827]MCQ0986568.1 S-methyl-5-thioribose kinase [Jiella sp. LLJ827]